MKFFVLDSVKTNNFTDENMTDKVQTIWKSSLSKLASNQGCTYGVYNHYQNDFRGDYVLSIAVDHPIEHCTKIIEPNPIDNYSVFNVENDHADSIYKVWEHIWGLEQDGKILRAYDVDFEKYYPDGRVEIYISLLN